MFCSHCGAKMSDGSRFCPACGAPVGGANARRSQASQYDDTTQYGQSPEYNQPPQQPQQPQYNQQPQQPQYNQQAQPPRPGRVALRTDRSLLVYILLSLVTCGIYSFFFIYNWAQDLNVACDGDGQQTAGLLKFILLSLITCGIYSFIWYYSMGNRLAQNAPRYGLQFTENGTTVLMWELFGILLCGIGPLIAMHILMRNTNAICMAYNQNCRL